MTVARLTLRVIAFLSVQAACGKDTANAGDSAQAARGLAAARPKSDSLLLAFEAVILRLGHSRDSLARSLGRPTNVEVEAAENMEGELDSLITVRYPHIEFLLRKARADGKEYFSNVTVVDSGFALPGDIATDRTTRATLTRLFGQPHRVIEFADSAAYTYDVPSGPIVQFYFLGDVLRKIRWVYEQG